MDKDTNKPSGALYEFIQEHIAPAMGDTFTWDKSPSPVPRQISALKSQKTDAVALLAFSPDRAKSFSYTDKPFYLGKSGIAFKSDASIQTISSVKDLYGLKIGYAKNTFITPFMRDKGIQFDMVGTANFLEINTRKLKVGRIEGAYSPDQAGLLYIIKQEELGDSIKVLKLPEKEASFHVVFNKSATEQTDRYNKAFKKVNGTGLYLKILGKYLDVSKL